jgi:hypothetical protein
MGRFSMPRSERSAKATQDHEVIRRWAEARGGRPATVRRTADGEPGILRINFPGYAEQSLENISWDEWFRKFDEKDLVFLFQERTAEGDLSRFFKIVDRETAEDEGVEWAA